MYISVYNLFYTALPVLALGIFECDVSDKLSIEYPKLYTPGLTNALFNTTEFIKSVLHGIFSALVLFLIPYGKCYSISIMLSTNIVIQRRSNYFMLVFVHPISLIICFVQVNTNGPIYHSRYIHTNSVYIK